jgi:uncharacterized DUF497 family protein
MILRWDRKKAFANRRKHGIEFHEAATVMTDPLATTFPDPDHSQGEQRFLTIGMSSRGRLLVVSHTEGRESIRIISARRVTLIERRFYEEG